MNNQTAALAYVVGGTVHTALFAAIAELASMPPGEVRAWALRGVATLLVGTPDTFRAAAVEQCPELASTEPIPDTYLNADEQKLASALSSSTLQELDDAIVSCTATPWRSVARIVGEAMVKFQGHGPTLPLAVYMQRLNALIQSGRLDARGDTKFMRLGEARLSTGGTCAA